MYTNNDFTINGIRYMHAYMLRALCSRVIRDYEKLFYLLITMSVRNRADILNRFLHFRSVYIPDIGLVTNSFDLKDAILTVRNYRLVSRWTD